MDCFEIKKNRSIELFFLEFFEGIKNFYPEVYANFEKVTITKIAGWPTPNGDFIMLYHNYGYDHRHPDNRNKVIIRQMAKIRIHGVLQDLIFKGDHNFINHFLLPNRFHENFEYEELVFNQDYEPVIVRNNKAKKRIKRQLKRNLNKYKEIIDYERSFVEFVDGSKGYTAVKQLDKNEYLVMDRKNNAYELKYFKPEKETEGLMISSSVNNKSIVLPLNRSIEDALDEFID